MQTNLTPDGILIKALDRFPGYGVTADGRLWSLWAWGVKPRRLAASWREMHPTVGANGYVVAHPRINGQRVAVKLHRLIAMAFLPGEGPEVNHIDGCKTNNHWANLKWCSRTHNARHASASGLRPKGEANHAKLKQAQVDEMREKSTLGTSTRALAEEYGIGKSTAHRIISGAKWRSRI